MILTSILNILTSPYTESSTYLVAEQQTEDIVLTILILLFVVFSIVYRNSVKLFYKMLQDFFQIKKRQSLFLVTAGNESFFRGFIITQTLILCTLAIYKVSGTIFDIPDFYYLKPLIFLPLIFLALLLYFGMKQLLYMLYCYIFYDKSYLKLWNTNYQAVIGSIGILLYIPVLCLYFSPNYSRYVNILLLIILIFSRLVIINKSIRIFYSKRDKLFYLILYLCAQEILPLIYLYEGLDYLYNFIQRDWLWL
ncbi:MAG: DUF4271 domain-containing protein [Tannerellaceae bacterium]